VSKDKFVSLSVGKKLRGIRKQKGVKSADLLSELMGGKYAPSAILRREEGVLKIDFDYLDDFCAALKLEGNEKNNVLTIARLDLWRSRRSMSEITKEIIDIKLRAQTHKKFIFGGLAGELQTYNYTKAIIESYAEYGEIEERTKMRFDAAQNILKDESKHIQIICPENSLYVKVGSSAIMLEQMENLREFHNSPQKEFRILPSVFLKVPNRESFSIYDSHFVFCQTRIGMVTAEDDDTVKELNKDFDILWENSVAGEDRNKLIDKAIEYYKSL
jgi:hypothetical protein